MSPPPPLGTPPAPGLPPILGQISDAGPVRRTGADRWSRSPRTRRGRPVTDDLGSSRRRRNQYGDEPAYGPVLGFTAGWYAIPAVLYAIWLVTLNSDRRALIGHEFVTSLPWLVAAIVLSLAVATLLRWATVGWRTLTLSFVAAVIGAGVATIAHSLSI